MSDSLWPKISIDGEKSPFDLLQEQGDFLSKETSGRIEGRVETDTEGNLFRHKLYITSAYIRNYRFLLVEIIHGIYFFPVYYYDYSLKIDKPRTSPSVVPKKPSSYLNDFDIFVKMYEVIPGDIPIPDSEIKDFESLKEALKITFNGDNTKAVIKTLLIQCKNIL